MIPAPVEVHALPVVTPTIPAPTAIVDSKRDLIQQLKAAESLHPPELPTSTLIPGALTETHQPGVTVLMFPSLELLKADYPNVPLDSWTTALDRRARHISSKLPALSIDKPHISSSSIKLIDMWRALEFIEFQFPFNIPVCFSFIPSCYALIPVISRILPSFLISPLADSSKKG